jgi:hypothetical protein
MKIPGFTAESSLYATFNTYQMVRCLEQSNRAMIPSYTILPSRKASCYNSCMNELGDASYCYAQCYEHLSVTTLTRPKSLDFNRNRFSKPQPDPWIIRRNRFFIPGPDPW